MEIKHFVFTNFGVGIKDFEWIAYRMELLLNITAKSLSNQVRDNFCWYIFLDKDIPYIHKRKLLDFSFNSKRIKINICEVDSYYSIKDEIKKIISNNCNVNDFILTSRIDDDDALNINAFDFIYKNALKCVEEKKELALISLTSGYEWLPVEQKFRGVSYESLALGLTLLSKPNNRVYSITQLAHHKAFETLNKVEENAVYIPLDLNGGGYLYTKHQLSDSYYFGSRARILQDVNSFSIDTIELQNFGLKLEDFNEVKSIFSKAPIGMPHKYLAKLAELNNIYKKEKEEGGDGEGKQSVLDSLESRIEWFRNNATRKNPLARNSKVRIAIVGSSVSRDLFNHRPELLENFEIVSYISRQSILGYVSTPCMDAKIKNRIESSNFEGKRALWDVEKSHWKILESSRPDIILIDFIDERIGSVFHDGTVLTPSGPIVKAFERANLDFEILRPWNEKISTLRGWAVREFLLRCYSICSNIILHQASWAKEFYDSEGGVGKFEDTKFKTLVGLHSNVLSDLFLKAEGVDIPFELIGGGDLMRAGGKHYWSFSPYHYDVSYYKQLSKDLVRRI